MIETAELIRKVREIEIATRRLSKHLFIGGYHSAFKGSGMSFSEVRSYQYGDDLRNIDWNVTARTGEPFVKIFEEEREINVLLMADVSASAMFGSGSSSKQAYITELCAVLAFSASKNHDKTGLLLFSDQTELYLAPAQGRAHNLRLIRELLNARPQHQRTDLEAACRYARNVLKKHSVVFLVSDFASQTDYSMALSILGRRHDCVGLHIWDPLERVLPDVGIVAVDDPETGERHWSDTTDPDVRRHYTERFDAALMETEEIFQKAGSDFISLCVGQDYTRELIRLFEKRVKV